MEVSIFEAAGLPEGAILSVRAGNTRRQAPVPLAGPLRFPNLPFNARQFKVDVMQSLGSSKVEINASKELESYSVAVDIGGQLARVGFTVREQPALCGKRACELKQVDKHPDSILRDVPPEKARAATDSRCYAQEHNIPNLVQEMLQAVLRDKPAAPFCAMAEFFRRKGEELGERAEAVPQGALPQIAQRPAPQQSPRAGAEAARGRGAPSTTTAQTNHNSPQPQPAAQRSGSGDHYVPKVNGAASSDQVSKYSEDPAAHLVPRPGPPPIGGPRKARPPSPGCLGGPPAPCKAADGPSLPPMDLKVSSDPQSQHESDPQRRQLEAEHLSLLAERASLLRELELLAQLPAGRAP